MTDQTIASFAHKSCGLAFNRVHDPVGKRDVGPGWVCMNDNSGLSPFPDDMYILSVGFLVVCAASVPLGIINMDEIIFVQIGAFFLLFGLVAIWMGEGILKHDLKADRVPFWNSNQAGVVGNVFFNYAFVMCIPSWINEKKPSVPVSKTFWISIFLAFIQYVPLGLVCGMAWSKTDDYGPEGDLTLLDALLGTNTFAKVTVYVFNWVVTIFGIPLFCVFIRYNLLENQIVGKLGANMLGVFLPFLIGIPLYTGAGFNELANWGSLICFPFVNFLFPAYFYMVAVDAYLERQRDCGVCGPTITGLTGSGLNSALLQRQAVEYMSEESITLASGLRTLGGGKGSPNSSPVNGKAGNPSGDFQPPSLQRTPSYMGAKGFFQGSFGDLTEEGSQLIRQNTEMLGYAYVGKHHRICAGAMVIFSIVLLVASIILQVVG